MFAAQKGALNLTATKGFKDDRCVQVPHLSPKSLRSALNVASLSSSLVTRDLHVWVQITDGPRARHLEELRFKLMDGHNGIGALVSVVLGLFSHGAAPFNVGMVLTKVPW